MNASRVPSIICILVYLVGCSTAKPREVDPSQFAAKVIPTSQAIRVGGIVQAATFDGKTHKGKVAAISDGTLSVNGETIEPEAIEGAQTRRVQCCCLAAS